LADGHLDKFEIGVLALQSRLLPNFIILELFDQFGNFICLFEDDPILGLLDFEYRLLEL
jgi:hypothetical protein